MIASTTNKPNFEKYRSNHLSLEVRIMALSSSLAFNNYYYSWN